MRRSIIVALIMGSVLMIGAIAPSPLVIEPGSDVYPAEAQTIEGDVPVTLSVDPAGPVRCVAGGGAEMQSLRRASCELIVRRNVFGPGVAGGASVAATYRFTVRWKRNAENRQFGGAIPVGRERWITYADYPPIAHHEMLTGRVTLSFEISDRGQVENCKVTRTNATEALAGAMCPLLSSRAIFLPAVDQAGQPRRANGNFTADWRWCDRTTCRPPDVR